MPMRNLGTSGAVFPKGEGFADGRWARILRVGSGSKLLEIGRLRIYFIRDHVISDLYRPCILVRVDDFGGAQFRTFSDSGCGVRGARRFGLEHGGHFFLRRRQVQQPCLLRSVLVIETG